MSDNVIKGIYLQLYICYFFCFSYQKCISYVDLKEEEVACRKFSKKLTTAHAPFIISSLVDRDERHAVGRHESSFARKTLLRDGFERLIATR